MFLPDLFMQPVDGEPPYSYSKINYVSLLMYEIYRKLAKENAKLSASKFTATKQMPPHQQQVALNFHSGAFETQQKIEAQRNFCANV